MSAAGALLLLSIGCRQDILRGTDRQVYSVIEERQQASLGRSTNVYLGEEDGNIPMSARMYDFDPRPTSPVLPEPFATRTTPLISPESPGAESEGAEFAAGAADEADDAAVDEELSPDTYPAALQARVQTFNLRDVLRYASQHATELQDAKEELYRAALDLTLERHLWTPQFVATMSTGYEDFVPEGDFDQALTAVADLAVTQQLPFGGEITAQVIDTLVREVNTHTTKGESGRLILQADIPLLRGAGRVAYESRYSAERAMIYAVRDYERFRRTFLVDIAADYFNLQLLKTAIGNTYTSYERFKLAWEKAEFVERMGRSRTVFDAPRAKSNMRQAESSVVSAKEQYASALDRFKVRIRMPVDALLDVHDQDSDRESQALDDLLPSVTEAEATDVALRLRLDLLNRADFVDDAARGVTIAENAILPDLDLRGLVASNSDPEHLGTTTFSTERTAWSAGIALRVDDRKAERNAYRASLISYRKAERDYETSSDNVRVDVRRSLRRISQQENLLRIQALNVEENERRLFAATAQFDLGRSTNQDVVDAENDLLTARNDYARAVASYRVGILELRRDTGTLRVGDDGAWNDGPTVDASTP